MREVGLEAVVGWRRARDRPEVAVHALLLSFGIIFVAELGDKSQLMALALAARYRPWPVLVGITIATGAIHAVSVVAGGLIGAALPTKAINVVAGVAFLGFVAWTFRGDKLATTRCQGRPVHVLGRPGGDGRLPLAELGDKTMLATVTLATTGSLVGTWIGSTLGMVAADAWPSSSAPSSGSGCRSGRSGSAPACRSWSSACS